MRIIGVILIFHFFLAVNVFAETDNHEIPETVIQGLEKAKQGGLRAAIDYWAVDGPMKAFMGTKEQKEGYDDIKKMEGEIGKLQAYKHLHTKKILENMLIIYTVLEYGNSLIFLKTQCHLRFDGRWYVTSYLYNANPSWILPDEVMKSLEGL
jgi:hypothetical protein